VKFFNYAEREKNTKKWLMENLKFPCHAYQKYNGFLGLVSWDKTNERLFIASKSTDEGEHAKLAEKILRRHVPMEAITKYLQQNNCTMLFEICTREDPHIISEPEGPVLLDIIDNKINFSKKPYEEVRAFAEKFGIRYKKEAAYIWDWKTLEPMLDNLWVIDPGHPVEGWVIEDSNGYCVKIKTQYYKNWKRLRTVMELIQKGCTEISEASFADGTLIKALYLFMDGLNRHGQLEGKSIIDVREAWLADDGIDFNYKPIEKESTNGSN
jgi:tRNA splicing ligase